jgi:hypothetical protein
MRALSICLVFTVAILAFFSGNSLLSTAHIEQLSRWKKQSDQLDQVELEKTLLETVNKQRKTNVQPVLSIQEDLQNWVSARGAVPMSGPALKTFMDELQEALPAYTNIRVQTATVTDAEAALPLLKNCQAVRGDDMDTLVMKVQPSTGTTTFDIMVVTALKTVEFSPAALNARVHPILATTCPNCNSRFALRSFSGGEPCSLVCPECETSFSLLVADNQGDYHYVNDFLVGYQPPARFPAGESKLDEVLRIWRGVYRACEYKSDSRGDKQLQRDAWQTGPETLMRGEGDCDDTSVLLADWLIARGFEARVALGEAHGEGHAWVVVLVEGNTYLLESTSEPPPLASDIGSTTSFNGLYKPDILFDRNACYYWRDKSKVFQGDYFSGVWKRLPQGQGANTKPAAPTKESPTFVAELKTLSSGVTDWQISWPVPK